MKQYLLIILFHFLILSAVAQKKAYYLFACAQKITKDICGEKVLIKSEEIALTATEAAEYTRKLQKELEQQYNTTNKYKNLQISLIQPGNAVIQFEGEQKYTPQADGWDCTSTFYGIVTGADVAAAERKFNALKTEYKRCSYAEMKRWSKSALQYLEHDDLEVKWVKTNNGIAVFLKNNRKDLALKLSIRSLSKTAATQGDLEQDANFIKLKKSNETSIELQPGSSAQHNLKAADAFEIDIQPVSTTKEDPSTINIIKNLIRRFIFNQDIIKEVENIGVRS